MPVDYSTLTVGDTISQREFTLDTSNVSKYVAAVRDDSGVFDPAAASPTIPPMAIGALALRGVLEDLGIPGGTLHTGQEMQFQNAVPVGHSLTCVAKIAQNSVRAGFRFVGVTMDVTDDDMSVMSAKSTIMVPA